MKIYNLITVSLFAAMTIGFSACSDNAAFENAETLIPVVDCNSTLGVTPSQYTLMISGDVLVKLVTPTTISTYQDANNTKTMCTLTGSAQLIRK